MREITQINIDKEKCYACSLCIKVCPDRNISLVSGKAQINDKIELKCYCGHCIAICPTQAISASFDQQMSFSSFNYNQDKVNKISINDMAHHYLMRRSCRVFKEKEINLSILKDLIKLGTLAPSGTNSQKWFFTIIPNRKKVMQLALQVSKYYEYLNRLSKSAFLRVVTKLLGNSDLDYYYKNYYLSVKKALDEFNHQKVDRLFHGAPAVIIIGIKGRSSCPNEDAILAMGQMILALESMGLGSCLIGYAKVAIERKRKLFSFLELEDDEKVYAVLALGYPDIKYLRPTSRKEADIRIV